MKRKVFLTSLAVLLAVSLAVVGIACIKIGGARSITGCLSQTALFAFDPVMYYWRDEVNSSPGGGIWVSNPPSGTARYMKVILKIQDDTSTLATMSTLLTAMVKSGDYDFVFPPCSTAFLQAAAAICSANNYVLLGAEGGCTTIQNQLNNYPYLFAMLNFSTWNQMEKLFEILRYCQDTKGASNPMKVYIIYNGDLHGYEYTEAFGAEMVKPANAGRFTVVGNVSVAPCEMNVQPQLQKAAGNNTDLFCSFTYPPTSLQTIRQAAALNINFDGMLVGPGCNFEYTLLPPDHLSGLGVGAGNMTGVMGFGAWNEYSSPKLAAFAADLTAYNWQGMGRYALDWWGHAPYYAGLQAFRQAIERAGTLDNDDVRDELVAAGFTTAPFDTVLSCCYFTDAAGNQVVAGATGGLLSKDCYAGQIGQWQYNTHGDGRYIFEVIDRDANNTADVVWPKPNW